MSQYTIVNEVLSYWRGLQPRERALISTAATLLLLTLLYAVLWLPMQRDLRHLRAALPQAQAQITQMRNQLAQVQQLKATRPAGGQPVSLQTAVEQSAAAAGLGDRITRLEARGANTAEVALDNVAFNSAVRWLAELQRKHPVQIEAASVERQTAPGIVNLRLTLRFVSA